MHLVPDLDQCEFVKTLSDRPYPSNLMQMVEPRHLNDNSYFIKLENGQPIDRLFLDLRRALDQNDPKECVTGYQQSFNS